MALDCNLRNLFRVRCIDGTRSGAMAGRPPMSRPCPCEKCAERLGEECGLYGPFSRCMRWHEWDAWSRASAEGKRELAGEIVTVLSDIEKLTDIGFLRKYGQGFLDIASENTRDVSIKWWLREKGYLEG